MVENDKNLTRTAKYSQKRLEIDDLNEQIKEVKKKPKVIIDESPTIIPINNNDGIDTLISDDKPKKVKEAPLFKNYKRKRIFYYLSFTFLAIIVVCIIVYFVLKVMEII